MGQYARIEKRIRDMARSAETERDEKFLARASEELNKGKDTRPLGKTLEEKKYRKAGEDFERMKLKSEGGKKRKPSADMKATSQPGQKQGSSTDLKTARRKLDRFRSVSRRMKSAADQMSASESQFKQLSENLDQAGKKMEAALREAEKQMGECGSCSSKSLSQLGEGMKKSNAEVGKIARALRGLDTKKKFFKKMDALRDGLARCQGALAGACETPSLAQLNQRGIGSQSDGRMSDRDSTEDARGLDTQLTGTKGEGPALVAVEDAASGDGVSTLRSRRTELEFRRQMESLVRREDVPEGLKEGVKNYFERIHEIPTDGEQAPADRESAVEKR